MPGKSTKDLTKVVYKPSTQSTDEFVAIVNAPEFKKWKDGDTTIPLVEVVDSFKIFFSNQGTQGKLGEASKQQLENTFGSTNDIDAMTELLKRGYAMNSEGPSTGSWSRNMNMGSFAIDTHGKGLRGI